MYVYDATVVELRRVDGGLARFEVSNLPSGWMVGWHGRRAALGPPPTAPGKTTSWCTCGSAAPSAVHVAFVAESIVAYQSLPPVHGPMHVTTSVTPPVVTTESSADGDCRPARDLPPARLAAAAEAAAAERPRQDAAGAGEDVVDAADDALAEGAHVASAPSPRIAPTSPPRRRSRTRPSASANTQAPVGSSGCTTPPTPPCPTGRGSCAPSGGRRRRADAPDGRRYSPPA